jgi:hypothetical protein
MIPSYSDDHVNDKMFDPMGLSAEDYHRRRLADGAACFRAALDYLARGWSVLALCTPDHVGMGRKHHCTSPGKRPWYFWDAYQERLPTEEEVRGWWRYLPTANLGGALGPVSGMVRVDVEGVAAQRQLDETSGGDLPVTLEFRSGRKDGTGRGILWSIPPGVVFRTTGTAYQDGELRFQAKGAQTVLPPSRHKDGGLYTWLDGRSPDDVPLAPAPDWAVRRWSAGTQAEQGARRPQSQNTVSVEGEADPRSVAQALAALRHLSPDRAFGYDSWLMVGMALHAVSDSEDMLAAWDQWSQQAEAKYQDGACAVKWASFHVDGGLGLADLLCWARRDSGWIPPRVVRRRGKVTIVVPCVVPTAGGAGEGTP